LKKPRDVVSRLIFARFAAQRHGVSLTTIDLLRGSFDRASDQVQARIGNARMGNRRPMNFLRAPSNFLSAFRQD
jgi:hypothetical protein